MVKFIGVDMMLQILIRYKIIQKYDVWGQWYVIPTLRLTTDKYLNGSYAIELVWLKWTIELSW